MPSNSLQAAQQATIAYTGPADDGLLGWLARVGLWRSMGDRVGSGFTQEQGQAVTRILLAAAGCLVFGALRTLGYGDTPFLLASIYLLGALLHLSFVTHRKSGYLWRRYLVIVLDLFMATFLTAWFGAAGIAFYPLFLWVMIGNGIRHGPHYMQFATLIGLLGFSGAMALSGFLQQQPGTYIGLMFGLVLMPKFFLVMIQRLAEANVELQAQRDQAAYEATHDTLTGLPNRAYLYERLRQALARARREARPVAVAFIDLDAFKQINDSYGHGHGDMLLTQVAEAMTSVMRESDTVARLGGDEFVVVVEDCAHGSELGHVLDRLFSCVGRYYAVGTHRTYVTWSCGVVQFPRDGHDVTTLLKHADTAMYAAKAQGPNHYAFYDPDMSAEVTRQLALRDELRLAMARGELEVYYQPIIEARSGRVCAAEALLRWHHPRHGTLSPGAFIEVAEHSGLIQDIGHWVVEQGLATAAAWQARVPGPVSMHVNVSPHQLRQADFVDQVRSLVEKSGLPSCVLDLEMTESALLSDAAEADRRLRALKGLGVQVALDDFGTGFSSLSYLRQLPVDLIKIDKSFIDGVPLDARNCALVDAILTLGDRLGHGIVAEGVETSAQCDWLVRHGCHYLQGYLFSPPVPREDFLALADGIYDTLPKPRQASGQ